MAINLEKRIKAFRIQKEMTQAQVAVVLGVSPTTLQRLETGTASGSLLTRARVTRRLRELTEKDKAA